MVIIKLQGGLGNQLFQYLAYQRLCEYYDVYFDVGDYNLPYNDGYRKFDLNSFITLKLKFVLFSDSIKKRLKYNLFFRDILILKESVRKKLQYIDLTQFTSVELSDMSSDLHQIPDNSYIVGWFSRERFISEWNKMFFYFNPMLLQNNKSVKDACKTILGCNSVSVHIRRTDYLLEDGNYQGICTDLYYKNSMDYFREKIENPIFYFFSDDINWCKNTFREKDIRFIDSEFVTYNNSTVEDLFLMSCCKHNILANSTFSWWGGYFNRNPNKIVLCPPAFSKNAPTSEIFPSEWIRMKNI